MTLRTQQITGFRADDEASNRFQEQVKQALNPLLRELTSPQGWQTPSLLNGWTNFGGGLMTAGFFRDVLGIVRLRGTVKGGTPNTTVFTLPPGYRPSAVVPYSVNAGTPPGIVSVTANGDVIQNAGGNASLSFDGIAFDVRP